MRLEKRGMEASPEIDKDLHTIASLTERIEKIARNLRHLTKPASPDFTTVNLSELLRSTVELLDSTTGSLRGFSQQPGAAPFLLKLDLQDEAPDISGDPHGLESAFINLILNSAHAVRDRGTGELKIQSHAQNGLVEVTFTDTGTGIHPDVLPHIFEPYYTTKGEQGTGLGMSILQNVAEIHGATLKVDSTYGSGTSVQLQFPASTTVAHAG
jgi:two-component system NtrC family sensor kinase